MVNYVEKLSKFWEKRRAVIPAEGLAQYDAMVRDLEAFKRELRKRGDEAKSQIEERYRKAQADKEYANRVIEERKQQAKENAARRNAEIEEQRRKIAERKAAEEEARKTKVETEYQALKREANQILKRRGRAYADEGAGVGLASPDDITLAERDDVSVEEMRPGTARLPSEGVFQTLDRRVMGDSDTILRNALMPYGDWNRATADALADFDLERFTTKEQRDAFLGRPRARRPGVAKEAFSAETLFSAAGTTNNDGMPFGVADLFQGAGIDLVGAGLGGTGSRAGRRLGAGAAGLGLTALGGLLSSYQALESGQITQAQFMDNFRDSMIMTVGSFGLQQGLTSGLQFLRPGMKIGFVGGMGLSILAGMIAGVFVDILNKRDVADTIQFIGKIAQDMVEWGIETFGSEAEQLRMRIRRIEGELGDNPMGVFTGRGGDNGALKLIMEIETLKMDAGNQKQPESLQKFIHALDNAINDYRTPKDQKTLLEIDRATVLYLSQLTETMQDGLLALNIGLKQVMLDLKEMMTAEAKNRKRVLIAVYQEGLNRINHIDALRREFGSAIRHSGVSSNGGAQVARLADANSRLEIPGTFRMQDWWEAEAFRNYGAFIDNGINSQSPKANWLVPKAYVDKLVDRPAAPYTKKITKGIEYWAPSADQPVFASQNYEWHMAPGASQAISTVGVIGPQLATVAHTGAYEDLKGKPTIPTVPTTWAWESITGKPTQATRNAAELEYTVSQPVSTVGVVQPRLATVAYTGAFADLSGRGHTHSISEIRDWAGAPDVSGYALSTHNHEGVYATAGHDHEGTYAPFTHSHSQYSTTGHDHDDAYASKRRVNEQAYVQTGKTSRILANREYTDGEIVTASGSETFSIEYMNDPSISLSFKSKNGFGSYFDVAILEAVDVPYGLDSNGNITYSIVKGFGWVLKLKCRGGVTLSGNPWIFEVQWIAAGPRLEDQLLV
eukprot:tig00020824_g14243.t1